MALRVDGKEELPGAIALLESGLLQGGMVLFGEVERIWAWFQALYKPVLAAGGMVSDEAGRLLAIHRLGVWDLPKGKVEPGEDTAAAAVREVQEECGLQRVERGDALATTWHTYERKGKRHLKRTEWYLMTATSDQPLTAQHEDGWIPQACCA